MNYTANSAMRDFQKHYNDKAFAKELMKRVKKRIKDYSFNQSGCGVTEYSLTPGTIQILHENGYIVAESQSEAGLYGIFFRECNNPDFFPVNVEEDNEDSDAEVSE